ncbi:MAG: hypothetical protein NVV74_11740 [Magnetospirillum sp.]|nr:hypothetical protein [Magnetospirillum sp.]
MEGVKAIGFDVPASAEAVPDVVSCPGTTTCRIGITNSQNFARQALAEADADPLAKGLSVHVSGCQEFLRPAPRGRFRPARHGQED